MFASKKLFGRSRSTQSRQKVRRLGTFQSLEDRRMFNVDYHGGPVIPNVQVETLYYGASWYGNSAMQQTAEQLNGYFSYLTGSSYMDLLSQYSTASEQIGHGDWVGGQLVDRNATPLGGLYLDDSEIRQMIDSMIYYGKAPQPNGDLVYFVFTDPNTEVTDGSENSIQDFAGYHASYVDPNDGRTVYYAVIPDPVGNGKIGNLTTFQQQTEVASHELAEAITDPVYPTGWFDSRYGGEGEIGDLANGQAVYLDNYAVQRLWSNQAGGPAAPAGATATPVQPLQVNGGFTLGETQGVSFNAEVGSFHDPNSAADSSAYTVQINWGDGQSSTGTAVAEGNGDFEVFGTHAFQSAGSFSISFTVGRPDDSLTGSGTSSASVTSPPVVTQPVEIAGQVPINLAPGDYTINQAMVTFVDPNGNGPVGNYQATIDWGDSQSSPGSISFDAGSGQFVVSGDHTYAGPGTYTISVSISNGSAAPATTSGSITLTSPPIVTQSVEITNEIPINLAPGNFTVNQELLTFVDPAGAGPVGSYQATISWGDGQSSSGSISFDAGSGQFNVSGDHTYAGPGTYLLTVEINNGSGTPATASGTITLAGAPIVTPPVVNPPVSNPPVSNPPVTNPPVTNPPLTPNEQYVTAIYQALLSRAPTAAELQSWAEQLDGGLARESFVNAIDHDDEYFATIIEPAYQQYLGRAADAAGIAYWTGLMQQGLTDQQLEADFIGSDEFYDKAGGTDLDWVDAMYQDLLGRPADAGGQSWWTNALAQGAGRASVAFGFTDSLERAEQLIAEDYQQYLGRSADQSGLAYFAAQFNNGWTNEEIITGFLDSDEYYNQHAND